MRSLLVAVLVALGVLAPSSVSAQASAGPVSRPVHVELRASEPDVSFYFVERAARRPAFCEAEKWRPECVHQLSSIRPLCVAPCSLDLAPSVRALGVIRGAGELVVVPGSVRLDRDGTLELDYLSRRPARLAGRVVLATLLPIAAGCFVGTAWTTSKDLRLALGLGGLGAATVGLALGFGLVTRGDRAAVRFVPLAPAP